MNEKNYFLHTTKFIVLLRTLSRKELSNFGYYLKSFYPGQETAIAIFDVIKLQHPELEKSKQLESSTVYKKVFKRPMETVLDRKKLMNYFADLNLWLTEFLIGESIKIPSFDRDLLWLKILKERKLDQSFFLVTRGMKKKYECLPVGNMWHCLKLMELNHLEFFHINYPKLDMESPTLTQCMNYLDLFYATAKLKYACEDLNRQNVLRTSSLIKHTPTAINIAKDFPKEQLLRLYQLLFQFNKSPSLALFHEIKQMLLDDSMQIDLEEQVNVLSYLINYTSSQLKSGKTKYVKEAFDLNIFGLKKGILLKDGFISPSIFHNIINLGCWLGEFEWVDSFLKNHEKYIKKTYRKDAVMLAKANIAYEKADYPDVLDLLNHVEFSDIHFALRAKTLILRTYFEQNQGEYLILPFCETFEKFVKRNFGVDGQTAKAGLNFIQLVKKLSRKKIKKAALKTEIINTELVLFKPWLLEKVKEYKQKFATRT